jgi:hypothetical protein
MTAASSRDQVFLLKGFADEPARGSCTVLSFDRAGRWRRAGAGLGKWWAVAGLCVFIPVAHFVLVPSFLVFGIYQCVQRLGTSELACNARGTCPDCGVEQSLDVAPRWQAPQQVVCASCRRGLELSVPR